MSGIKRKILSLLFLLPPSGVTCKSGGSWADITDMACVKYRNNKLVVFLKWRKTRENKSGRNHVIPEGMGLLPLLFDF